MAERHDTMMNPHIEGLLNRTNSKFRLVTLASQRARQINAYFGHLGDGLGTTVPPQVTSLARKPLSIAFEEIAADKIVGIAAEPVDELGGFDVAPFDPATFEGAYEGDGLMPPVAAMGTTRSVATPPRCRAPGSTRRTGGRQPRAPSRRRTGRRSRRSARCPTRRTARCGGGASSSG